MEDRRPLSFADREDLRDAAGEGDESMIGDFTPPYEVLDAEGNRVYPELGINAYPHDGEGKVWTACWAGEGAVPLTPDQARQFAAALLLGADHAEYGPGRWERRGDGSPEDPGRREWVPTIPRPGD